MKREIAVLALARLYRLEFCDEPLLDHEGNERDLAAEVNKLEALITAEHKDHKRMEVEATNLALGNRAVMKGN